MRLFDRRRTLLVRPDGYIGYAGIGTAVEAGAEYLEAAGV